MIKGLDLIISSSTLTLPINVFAFWTSSFISDLYISCLNICAYCCCITHAKMNLTNSLFMSNWIPSRWGGGGSLCLNNGCPHICVLRHGYCPQSNLPLNVVKHPPIIVKVCMFTVISFPSRALSYICSYVTHTHTHRHARTHARTRTRTRTHAHAHAHTHIYTRTHTHTHTHTNTHTHTHTHARTHAHTHTLTPIHTDSHSPTTHSQTGAGGGGGGGEVLEHGFCEGF